MNRRAALQQLMVTSAGLLLIPSCFNDDKKFAYQLKELQISADQQATIAELAEAIIPKTNTPGAKDLKIPEFVSRMLRNCESPDNQQRFLEGFNDFYKMVKDKTGSSFLKATPQQRSELLAELEKLDDGSALSSFYKKMKGLTIRGYTQSQHYLTQVQVYELVPARWHGCVPAKQTA
jgi:hypothetical protein